ncbi:MAG: histidine kinase dimerization/phosphoacceptor domain -containing protein, partial [Spirochaetaceae bacterium]
LVRVRENDIKYWPGRGDGTFGTGELGCQEATFADDTFVAMTDSPWFSDPSGTALRVTDVNGDGLADLVHVRFNEVDVWLNVDGTGWTPRRILGNVPVNAGHTNRVRIVDVNGALCELLCYSKEELKESTLCRILPPACDAAFLSAEEKEIPGFETQLIAKDGTPRQCEVSIKEVYVREDRRIMQTIIRDISDRLAARANLEKELQEKRTLLRELYHRTKNNMQVISSMLSIKGRKMRGTEAESELEDINSRILAMSLVHRRLYESQNLSRINIREYLVELAGLLRRSYSRRDKEITIDAVAEDHMVSIDVAVPLGQVVTELLSNSLKHAFGKRSHGKITIELQEGTPGRLLLTYYDDGVGLPPGFGFESHGNLGLETVRLMVEDQLNGTIEILPTRGAGFRIELPKSDFEELHY